MTNPAKAAGWTALFSFLTLFGAALVGWLNDLMTWATPGSDAPFPDPSALRGAAVAAGASAAIGLVNFVIRWVQTRTGTGEVPTYVKADAAS